MPQVPRNRLLLWTAATIATLASAAAAEPPKVETPARQRPSFLVIVADDMGFSDAGCYGGEIATPNLDRLAAGGLRFTQFYSTGRCWPSRTAIVTGYYPQQVRADPPKGRLPAWARVLPAYLKPQGYRCYHSGKWHVPGAPKVVADGGFDHSYVIHDHDRFFAPKNHELDDQRLPPVAEGTDFYLTTAIAQHAIDFLGEHAARHSDQPFCVYLAFTSPHFPLHALQEDIDRYRDRYLEGWDAIRQSRWRRMREMGLAACDLPPQDTGIIPGWNWSAERLREAIGPGEAPRAVPWKDLSDEQKTFQATKMAIHAAMIDRMDREIGRVLDQLKAMKAFDNTAVFFVSDNGASAEQIIRGDMHDKSAPLGSGRSYLCLGPGWSTAANTPLRLHKHWNHEGGISSPLIVHWPAGVAARGELRHAPGHFVDLLPTIVDLAGGTLDGPADAPAHPGRSLARALAADVPVARDCLYFHHQGNRAIRVGDWKLVAAGQQGPWELYDLKTDRCESNNLADRHPDKVRELSVLWQQCDDTFRQQAGPAPEEPRPRKKRPAKE